MQTKHHEQENLLRFKTEVLVNLLSVEEQRNEVNNKRIETLKWLLYSQGVNEDMLTNIVVKLEAGEQGEGQQGRQRLLTHPRLLDLQGAIQRMTSEFELYKEDIVRVLATEDGKIIPSLSSEDFMRQVFSVTEHVSKSDLTLLSLRFDDGYGQISVVDFLDFFATPVEVRTAKSAANAVRMSLDLLEINQEDTAADLLLGETSHEDTADHSQAGESGSVVVQQLDVSARKLVVMWHVVAEALEKSLLLTEQISEDTPQLSVSASLSTITADPAHPHLH
ncbi:hypothetical protein EON64_20775, partial [archaeon]